MEANILLHASSAHTSSYIVRLVALFCGLHLIMATSRICIVTGANKGIGYQIARKMGASGMKVIMGCRNAELGQQATADLVKEGYDVDFLPLDISSKDSIDQFAERFERTYQKVDILVNNAGFAFKGSDPTPFAQQAGPTFNINFFGTLNLTQKLLPLLKKSDDPRIINVASMTGHLKILKSQAKRDFFLNPSLTMDELVGAVNEYLEEVQKKGTDNSFANSNYGMSKLAVISMTRILARDEPGIKVNCFCPGMLQLCLK